MPPATEELKIHLPLETLTALRLNAAARRKEPEAFIADLVQQRYSVQAARTFDISDEEKQRWDSMTDAEQQAEIDALAEGFEDFEAGRFKSHEQVLATVRSERLR